MIGLATAVSGALLILAAIITMLRLVQGPSVADRMIALDTMLFLAVGGLGIYVVSTRDTTYLPVLVIAVLTAFLSTVVVARYIEAENRDG